MKLKKSTIKLVAIILMFFTVFSLRVAEKVEAQVKRFNMTFLYFGNTSNYTSYVDKTMDSLNMVSPSYFDLNPDGTLKLTDKIDVNFINNMHERSKRVVPFLSNHWDRNIGRKALENREVLSEQIVQAVKKYNLDGVNVDIENVTEVDRDNYTDFVRLLREKLPEDKEVSVSVAANPRGLNIGWHGSYDYESLAQYSDYLLIMAYDESYFGSSPGPVASIGFVEESIKYALKRVPAEKIVLGIPFYGRYWNINQSKGGYGIDLNKVNEILGKYGATVVYDSVNQSPKAVFTITDYDDPTYVYGRRLMPGEYVIWFENEESIKQKLMLVQKYNLKGTGSWSLGQETSNIWEFYSLWLNGKYFNDIEGHWAHDAILFAQQKEWMKGISGIKFSPDSPLTRAQAAVILVRILGLNSESTYENQFKDVPSEHWANKEINIARNYGLIEGVGNNLFAPEEPITREQMAVMLDRMLNLIENILLAYKSKDIETDFIDISYSDWSFDSIVRVSRNGIFRGYDDGYFRPDRTLTRAEMAQLLQRISPQLENETINLVRNN